MTYDIIINSGKNKFYEERNFQTLDEAKVVLQSLYEIDKAKGMNPHWLSGVTFSSEGILPNGLSYRTSVYIRKRGCMAYGYGK